MAHLRTILQFFLAATFLFSAYTKAIAPGFFEILLEQQGLGAQSFVLGHGQHAPLLPLKSWLGLGLLLSILFTLFAAI